MFNGGELRDAALRLQAVDGDWLCVALARYELGNVAWKLMRADRLTADAVVLGWSALAAAEIQVVHEIEWAEVSALALVKKITFYDAAHVWLALSRNTFLYSRDGPLREKCPEVVRGLPLI